MTSQYLRPLLFICLGISASMASAQSAPPSSPSGHSTKGLKELKGLQLSTSVPSDSLDAERSPTEMASRSSPSSLVSDSQAGRSGGLDDTLMALEQLEIQKHQKKQNAKTQMPPSKEVLVSNKDLKSKKTVVSQGLLLKTHGFGRFEREGDGPLRTQLVLLNGGQNAISGIKIRLKSPEPLKQLQFCPPQLQSGQHCLITLEWQPKFAHRNTMLESSFISVSAEHLDEPLQMHLTGVDY